MNAPLMPTCCTSHRLDAMGLIEALIANDAAATVAALVESGWFDLDAALEELEAGYARWWHRRIDDAVMLGLGWAAIAQRAA